MATASKIHPGNSATLTKIDKLRLVVVGDQSSGKSSVLEGITSFAFPRAAELCTRYATQITCRRETLLGITVSIIPHEDASPEAKQPLLGFRRTLTELQDQQLAIVFKEANEAMGIDSLGTGSAFSEHVLKIEITGPDQKTGPDFNTVQQEHFTVIDVPGIFRRETAGLTTEGDINLVRRMVQSYMKDQRTIILAIIPSNVDPATQEILKLAKEADPEMKRTMAVLTKPDLNIERTTQQIAIDYVTGKRSDLTLGYYIVKNRGPDDMKKTLAGGQQDERQFFANEPWSACQKVGRAGIDALKLRVRELLTELIKKEFPKLRGEISKSLSDLRSQREKLGKARSGPQSQMEYLCDLSDEFQAMARHGLTADYSAPEILFWKKHMAEAGHTREFDKTKNGTGNRKLDPPPSPPSLGHLKRVDSDVDSKEFEGLGGSSRSSASAKPLSSSSLEELLTTCTTFYPEREIYEQFPELERYRDFGWRLSYPTTSGSIHDYIELVYNLSRGRDMGNFGESLISTLFREQSRNWEPLTLCYVSRVLLIIHHFAKQILDFICPDPHVRNELWDNHILEALQKSYDRAMEHARFLLKVEREGIPYTLNHYFNENLQKAQNTRLAKMVSSVGEKVMHSPNDISGSENGVFISLESFRNLSLAKSNSAQIVERIHDVLASYYKVARKRFVDVVCQQVVEYFLLSDDENCPLQVFTSKFVRRLNVQQLDDIAGEDASVRDLRAKLDRDIGDFEGALDILKGSV
ncbi:interferon-induced GTP-binding protein Mx1 [Apiospora rasikravindrae]|uniref:Interferon-induced GTP-binding protein Mx1 n=1 Tax=Apiospora rasikravindrae TaxID=990691 RepID=A0ABR1SQS9_9PEZI